MRFSGWLWLGLSSGLLLAPSALFPESPTVQLDNLAAASDKPTEQPKNPLPMDQRVGFAVVGLGHLALGEILPAFASCRFARLAALVSSHPDKMAKIGLQYGVAPRHQYTYQSFDQLKTDDDVRVVYIVLPNSMHREFTERAAAMGKHVLCEKPMATSVQDAQAMIDACKKTDVQLMIAYRLQYEPYNRAMIQLTREKELGELKTLIAENTHSIGKPDQFRLNAELAGGGPLPDMGIYCINAARYITGEEPISVFGDVGRNPSDSRFKEVEEQVNFILRFPSGVTMNGYTGYNAHSSQRYRLYFTNGWAELDPAFPYQGLRMRVAHRSKDGQNEIIEERQFPEENQFSVEMDHMARCIIDGKPVHTPGEEGLADQKIIDAIFRSGQTHQAITLPEVKGKDASRGPTPKPDH